MANYTVLLEVSKRLRDLLWDGYDPQTRNLIGPTNAGIVFLDPTRTAQSTSNKLSLWLYQVTENEFVKNQPCQPINGSAGLKVPPLSLNLFFLITPFADQPESDLLILGDTMRVLYDNAVLELRSPAANVTESLRVILRQLPLEELSRVWEALQEPYRLSVPYEIRVVTIDSAVTTDSARVAERTAGLATAAAVANDSGGGSP